jgi:hypothetical protein
MIKTKIIQGVARNDVDYDVHRYELIDGEHKLVWLCPYYKKWFAMINRCYGKSYSENKSTYKDCAVCDEWLYLSNFIKWVNSQPNKNWQSCQLDKDLLFIHNKLYSPETCVFVSSKINSFITYPRNSPLGYMIGVTKDKRGEKFTSRCCDPFGINDRNLGAAFLTEIEAHKAWQAKKHEYACQLADLQDDPLVAKALRERYAPDKDWTN